MEPAPPRTEVMATIPDPRDLSGRRHPLQAILNLLVVMLAGMRSLEAIAHIARDHCTPLGHALGFRSAKTPWKATLSNRPRRLDVAALQAANGCRVAARCHDLGDQLCVGGMTVRGTRDLVLPGSPAPRVVAVDARVRVDRKTNDYRDARELLGVLPLTGAGVAGDAMFCHRDVSAAVTTGVDLFTVNDTQPMLHYDLVCLFGASAAFSPYQQSRCAAEHDTAATTDKGHGRAETRTLRTTLVLPKYLSAWPGLARVFPLHRVRRLPDGRVEETSVGITSLRPLDAGAARRCTSTERTGRSRTTCTGFATSPSVKMTAGFGPVTSHKSSPRLATP
jgi:hypothetical protein